MNVKLAWMLGVVTLLVLNTSFSAADGCVSTSYRLYFLLSTAAFYFLVLLFCIFAVILYYCEKKATKAVSARIEPKLVPEVKKVDDKTKQRLPN
uniref:Envelope glycoprotein N n=1 Tax=Ditylenchus dipsaci TaxID=166011 RepID=A0A915DJP3_9BILA